MTSQVDLQAQLRELRERVAECESEIGESQRAQEMLGKERDFVARLLDTVQVIVLVLDPEAHIVSFNSYMEQLSGYRLEEVKNRDWFETFVPDRDRERFGRVFRSAVGDIQTRGNVDPILTRDGREREIVWYDTTLPDADGRVEGVLSVGLDITDRLQLEREQRQLQSQLEDALAKVISGFVPICSVCKSIRNQDGEWAPVEACVRNRTGAQFSHGLCEPCARRLYPGFDLNE